MWSKPTTTKPKKAEGQNFCKAQVEIPCSVKPFVHMKCIVELWHGSLLTITGIFPYTNGFLFWLRALALSSSPFFKFLEPED